MDCSRLGALNLNLLSSVCERNRQVTVEENFMGGVAVPSGKFYGVTITIRLPTVCELKYIKHDYVIDIYAIYYNLNLSVNE